MGNFGLPYSLFWFLSNWGNHTWKNCLYLKNETVGKCISLMDYKQNDNIASWKWLPFSSEQMNCTSLCYWMIFHHWSSFLEYGMGGSKSVWIPPMGKWMNLIACGKDLTKNKSLWCKFRYRLFSNVKTQSCFCPRNLKWCSRTADTNKPISLAEDENIWFLFLPSILLKCTDKIPVMSTQQSKVCSSITWVGLKHFTSIPGAGGRGETSSHSPWPESSVFFPAIT